MSQTAAVRPVISIRDLKTAFGTYVVHEHLNLDVMPGEILSLIGGSGSGKTTLLRQILGLEHPAAGRVEVFGQALHDMDARTRALLPRRWGMLFQSGALFSALSVFDNVALPLRELRALPEAVIRDVVMMRLAQVGLTPGDALKQPSDLSGGMIKRVALARALALDPDLVFLDEPTAGLDPQRSAEFVELIRQLNHQLGFTVVMVTHDVDTLVAMSMRVAVLAEKRVIVCDTVDKVMQFDHPFIKAFFQRELEYRSRLSAASGESVHGKP